MITYHKKLINNPYSLGFTAKDRTPFFYIITHKVSKKRYAGCKTSKGCHPSQLWSTYFTSSNIINNIIKNEGRNIFSVEIRNIFNSVDECLTYETNFLKKINASHNQNWFNLHNGDGHFSTGGKTLGPYSMSRRKNISNALTGKNKSIEHCKNMSMSHLGIKLSDYHLLRRTLGQTELIWINKHNTEKKIKKELFPYYEQLDFKLGRIKGRLRPTLKGKKLTLRHKNNISKSLVGHITTEETRQLLKEKNKNQPKNYYCKYCSRYFVKGHFNQWHGDKCKCNPNT